MLQFLAQSLLNLYILVSESQGFVNSLIVIKTHAEFCIFETLREFMEFLVMVWEFSSLCYTMVLVCDVTFWSKAGK